MHRLTLSLILVVLIAIAGLGWGLDQLFNRYLGDTPQNDSLSAYQAFGSSIAQTLNHFAEHEALLAQWQNHADISLSLSTLDAFPLPPELASGFMQGEPLTLATAGDISLNYYMPNKQQVLSISLRADSIDNSSENLQLIFTLIFYSGILGLVLLWLYPLVRRLLILSSTAKAFGEGDLSQRVQKGSISYISGIENEFNKMAQRIETLVSDNKLLSSAVSHDLRTPLARLRFGIDALAETDDPATRKKYEQHISNDIDEMQSLIEILLSYAKLDRAMIEVEKLSIDLTTLLLECVNATHGDNKKISLQVAKEPCRVDGDARYLGILVNNLLQNALQHAKSHIQITLQQQEQCCELLFEDDGPGIAKTQRKQVLKPFVRGDSSRQVKGYGMGLAIVLRIIEWHGGSINITQSENLGGACIHIQVPLNNTIEA